MTAGLNFTGSGAGRYRWLSGPFASQGWSGSQKFEVTREGKAHIIRLMPRTIGTNSTDSNEK